MIRFIAALDSKNGLANDHGIPWLGKLPTDMAYFRSKTLYGNIMMGRGWYIERKLPLLDRRNLVATKTDEALRPGFERVTDAENFLKDFNEDIWVGGGAALFANTLELADELYLTRLDKDFSCTKFFPDFEDRFELLSETEPQVENDITFVFQVWQRKA